MGSSTVYDVKLRYLMDDQATRGVRGMDSAMQQAARSGGLLEGSLGKIMALAGGYLGFGQAKRSLIDFNSEMQQSRITMAGLFEMNLGGEFADNMGRANALVDRLQIRMKSAVGTTAEAVHMASMLAQGFAASHASAKDMEDMTVGAVVGAKAMNIAADVAARDVDQALRGQFHSVDQFTGKLLGAKEFGYQGTEGRERFNALKQEERFQVLKKALNSKALKDMAQAQESSWAGVASTFQDNLEMALGKVGLPLFKKLTEEVKSWNTWIDKNESKLREISKSFSDGLVTGFGYLKDVIGFIVEHKDLLITVAKMWAASKLIGGAASGSGLAQAFTALQNPVIAAGVALAGLTLAAQAFVDWVNKTHEANIEKAAMGNANLPDVAARLGQMHSMGLLSPEKLGGYKEQAGVIVKMLQQTGAVGSGGAVNKDALRGMLDAMTSDERRALNAGVLHNAAGFDSTHLADSMATELARIIPFAMTRFAESSNAQKAIDANASGKNGKGKSDVKVTINRIEVQSDDPDRFVFTLSETIGRSLRHHAGAMGALPEG